MSACCSKRGRVWESWIQWYCIRRKEPDKALSLLRDWLRLRSRTSRSRNHYSCHGILPSSFTLCSLIRCFSSQGNMSGAVEVVRLMNDEKLKYPYRDFVSTSIIAGFCKMREPELGLWFFQNALSVGALRPNLVTYTVLLSALRMLGTATELFAAALVGRMEKEGIAFDVVFYSSLMCGYLGEGMLMQAFRKHKDFVSKGINPDVVSYTLLVEGFSKLGNTEKAVGILHKMIRAGLKPNLVTYTAIVLGFCKKGKIDEAFAVFSMLKDKGIEVDEFIYAILVDGLCRKGEFSRVYQLLNEMEEKGITPSIITYNTLINGLCKTGRTSDADEFSKGIMGDIVTYTTLLHGYTVEENIMGIIEIKRRLEEAGVGMDIVLCNTLIKAHLMVGAFEDAFAVYRRVQELDLVADSVTYHSLIDGFCKVGRIKEALEIFDEFRRSLVSSVECYNCMINGLCKNNVVDLAIGVFIELNEKCLPLDAGIYWTLMEAIVKMENAEEVLNLISRIQNLRLDVYNDAISLLCKKHHPIAAGEVFWVLRRNGIFLTSKSHYLILKALIGDGKMWLSQPILNTFIKEYGLVEPKVSSILLHYLCLKDVNKALCFLNKMKMKNSTVSFPVSALKALAKSGRVLAAYELVMGAKDNLPAMDVVDYTIIVDELCKEGNPVKALDLCVFAEKNGTTLNIVTYNSVINGLCHQGCLVEAFRLFDSLERTNLIATEITYTTLIDHLCKQGYILDAQMLFDRMTLNGYKASTSIYNSFLNFYCKFGQMKEALKILNEMQTQCLDPDEFTASTVIYGYSKIGDLEGALRYFYKCNGKDIFPDIFGFLYLIKGLFAKGRMEEARSILREMLQSQSIMELMNKVSVEVETESIGSVLAFLCEQGSIKEAVTVLDELCSIFVPVRKWFSSHSESQELLKFSESENIRVDQTAVPSHVKTDLAIASSDLMQVDSIGVNNDDMQKKYQLKSIDYYYILITSLCSRGELQKANTLAKEMLASLDGDARAQLLLNSCLLHNNQISHLHREPYFLDPNP